MTAPAASISPVEHIRLVNARHDLVTAADAYTRALRPEDPAPINDAADRLATAARRLVDLTDQAPERLKPEGWPQ
ncbi:hypothetical protein [Parafrankia sp. FMc2]|uniref:hypothetical protein n=1 Tax=Parafrankia sp. FMc2 TaxID=3233196 RepID=UPI0034D491C8